MTTFIVRNDHSEPIQFLMEPSGHYFEMPAGAEFVVAAPAGARIKVHLQEPDVMVEGDVSSVTHDGEVLASWTSTSQVGEMLQSREDLRRYLLARGTQIIAEAEGLTVFRQAAGKSWACQLRWSDDERALFIEGSPGLRASADVEAALALAVCRINRETALPGFRLLPATPSHPNVGITYAIVLMLDDAERIAASVVERALAVWFGTVALYAERLATVAAGGPDPGTP